MPKIAILKSFKIAQGYDPATILQDGYAPCVTLEFFQTDNFDLNDSLTVDTLDKLTITSKQFKVESHSSHISDKDSKWKHEIKRWYERPQLEKYRKKGASSFILDILNNNVEAYKAYISEGYICEYEEDSELTQFKKEVELKNKAFQTTNSQLNVQNIQSIVSMAVELERNDTKKEIEILKAKIESLTKNHRA